MSYDYDVFLFHADEDQQYMEFTRDYLAKNNLRVKTRSGLIRDDDVNQAIDNSATIVFILTPNFKYAEEVRGSLIHCILQAKGVSVSLLADGDLATSVPYGLMTTPIIDFTKSFKDGVQSLFDKLREFIPLVHRVPLYVPDSTSPEIFSDIGEHNPIDKKSHDVYLSYRSTDREVMYGLWEALLNGGLSVWVDIQSISPGGDWRVSVENGIESCRAMVVQLSENVNPGSFVLEDLAYADANNVLVFPVAIDDTALSLDHLFRYVGNKTITDWDLRHSEDVRAANLKKLVDTVSKKLYDSKPLDPAARLEASATDMIDDDETAAQDLRYDVFISYSRKDTEAMKSVVSILESQQLNVWYDAIGIPVSTPDWDEAIRTAIKDSANVVYLASPDARRSGPVKGELVIGKMLEKPLYPILVRGEDWTEGFPVEFMHIQFEDGRTNLEYAARIVANKIQSGKSKNNSP